MPVTVHPAPANGTYAPAASTPGMFHQTSRSAGDAVINSTSYVAVDVATDLAVVADAGNKIQVGLTTTWLNQAVVGRLDVGVIVDGSPVFYIGSQGASPATYGIQGWTGFSGTYTPPSNTVWLDVQAGHISADGYVRLRLYAKADTAAVKTLAANSGGPLYFWARNHG